VVFPERVSWWVLKKLSGERVVSVQGKVKRVGLEIHQEVEFRARISG